MLEPSAEGAKKTISGGRLPADGGSDGAVRVSEVVGGERGAPRPADQAEADDGGGRDAWQDLFHDHVFRQHRRRPRPLGRS